MKGKLASWFQALSHLFYPQLCLACAREEVSGEQLFCAICDYELPRTDFHLHRQNPFTDRLQGRFPLEGATALLYFGKGGAPQKLLHQLKYAGQQDVGVTLGRFLGESIREYAPFDSIDLIVPVPLHPQKERLRGYNQSECLARGLQQALEKPTAAHALQRLRNTETQTHKSKLERLQNLDGAFAVKDAAALQGKHILLVDDVLTTGATLEAVALTLLKVSEVRVSVATLAFAEYW